jgi:hypothetical protein
MGAVARDSGSKLRPQLHGSGPHALDPTRRRRGAVGLLAIVYGVLVVSARRGRDAAAGRCVLVTHDIDELVHLAGRMTGRTPSPTHVREEILVGSPQPRATCRRPLGPGGHSETTEALVREVLGGESTRMDRRRWCRPRACRTSTRLERRY